MRAYIVVDLGFGDAGKGLLTDFLARHHKAGLVVRYNGGAQAGHNVVAPDGRHHTFSQFGSGTFIPGVKTYLSRHVVIHPGALLVEGDILAGQGVRDAFSRLRLSDQALIITPFHQAANRIREIARGAHRHGSCGVGVGEAVDDALAHPENRVLAGDLTNPTLLRRKLRSVREQEREQIAALCKDSSPGLPLAREWEIFEREDVIDAWIASISRMGGLGLVAPDSLLERWLRETGTVVFEGAQGVLLDADAGFHPFTTWSRCTAANAFELIRELSPGAQVSQIGVMRCYAVRHGPGPLPTETDALAALVSEHNQRNDWQGAVRYGWFDAVLARYALGLTGRLDALLVTHLDALPRLKTWTYCAGYKAFPAFDDSDPGRFGGVLTDFHLPSFPSLAQREQFTQALSTATPLLETYDADEERVIQKIETLLGQPVGMVSRGPGAGNVQVLNPIPA
ncbi:MAG: adenylosuccinate synthetase [Anaerolineales bacterium]